LKIEDRKITLDTNEGTKEITVPSNIKLSLNGKASDLSALKPSDDLTVVTTNSGNILELNAVSGEVTDYAKYLIPGLLAVLVIGTLLYLLTRNLNKPKIKTQV
jgi:hypothetical protein